MKQEVLPLNKHLVESAASALSSEVLLCKNHLSAKHISVLLVSILSLKNKAVIWLREPARNNIVNLFKPLSIFFFCCVAVILNVEAVTF